MDMQERVATWHLALSKVLYVESKNTKRKRSKPHILLLTCVPLCHDASFEGPIQTSPKSHLCQQVSTWRQSPKFVGPTIIYISKFLGLMLRVGFRFLLNLILNRSPKHHLQRLLPCRHLCQTWDFGLWTSCEVVNKSSDNAF